MTADAGSISTGQVRNHKPTEEAGFTLIELVMVIVILAIVSVAVVPRLTSLSEASVNRDARLLVNYLTMAQQLAMSRSDTYGVCFDLGNSRYSVSRTDCTDPGTIIPSPESRADPLRIEYDATLSIAPASATSVFFDYLGRPTPNGITITVSSGSYSVPITVEANTGFVHAN